MRSRGFSDESALHKIPVVGNDHLFKRPVMKKRVKQKEHESCKNCTLWLEDSPHEIFKFGGVKMTRGACKCKSPIYVKEDCVQPYAAWPPTWSINWCGEWEAS